MAQADPQYDLWTCLGEGEREGVRMIVILQLRFFFSCKGKLSLKREMSAINKWTISQISELLERNFSFLRAT